MERLQADLEGAQHHFGAGLGGYGAGAELLAIVGKEVAAVAIGLEHGGDLTDHVGVPGARDADVPFQAADLRGVREVGGADVRGGEARLAVEEPGLRVESRGSEVVGDEDLGAELVEFVEGALFGGAGVGGGENAEGAAGVAVLLERRHHGADAAAADEGHHNVYAIGGVDFGEDLMADAGFVGGVGEEGGVEEGREGGGDGLGRAVGLECEQRVKDWVRGAGWALGAGLGIGDGRLDEVHDLAREGDAFADAVFVLQAGQGVFDHAGEVEGKAVGCFGHVQRPAACVELRADLLQPCFQGLGDEFLVEAAGEGRHCRDCRSGVT